MEVPGIGRTQAIGLKLTILVSARRPVIPPKDDNVSL